MNIDDRELAGLGREKAKRAAKKKNDAFRRQLHERRMRQRELMKLRLASLAAAAAWVSVGIRWLH